jgi:hypothetical protein
MTSSSSGRHRNQVPSPHPRGAAASLDRGDPAGPHSSRPPLLRVVKGEPSADELAALTVVVTALAQHRPRRRPAPVGAWASPATSLLRAPLRPGPGGWLASGRTA